MPIRRGLIKTVWQDNNASPARAIYHSVRLRKSGKLKNYHRGAGTESEA